MTKFFNPITKGQKDYTKYDKRISRKRNSFNDKRLDLVHGELSVQMKKEINISVNQVSNTVAKSAKFYRFFKNEKVTCEELISKNTTIAPEIIKDKMLLCIGDSSAFNMKKGELKVKDFHRFGVLQDGKTPGFHAHASLVLDASDNSVLGLSDVILWNRPVDKDSFTSSQKEDKESYKWHLGVSNSHQVLSQSANINYVFDREADDFSLFQHILKQEKSDFTIRAKHNRKVRFEGKICRLSECLASLPVALTYETHLSKLDHYSSTSGTRKKRKARDAQLELRFANVEVFAPTEWKSDETLPLSVVEVREITPNLPSDETPLHWIIWTSKHLNNAAEALQVVNHYLGRWTIEQLFRVMKKQGFNQETTQLNSVDGILKQTAMTFPIASQVMQLVNARDQENGSPIEVMFNEEEQKLLKKASENLEGKTTKLKNPFAPSQLSYASWVIGRLGGWKGYKSQKPPGPITMKIGLNKFRTMVEGYQFFNNT